MRNRVYIAIVVMGLVGLFASSANAQMGGQRLTANIPFEFQVGNAILPAGEYAISTVSPASGSLVLRLRSEDGGANAIVHMIPVVGKTQNSSKLIFHCYGSQYFFTEAWTDGESTGLQAPASRTERATQRELAGLKPRIQEVVLNAVSK